jgi:soluble lytic murein transglycosylase-like protein
MTGHRILVCLAVLLCLRATPVAAQIYALRDPNGVLVLSDKPLGEGAQTFALPGASAIRTTSRATALPTDWDDVIDEEAAARGVRADLVRAVIQVESAFNPRARSRVGAMGLMQLMPGTAADLGVRNPWNPEENIRGGVAYLRTLLDQFNGNEELALAAYNAGPGAVTRYGYTIPPYRETRDYVKKVRARTETVTTPRSIVYRVIDVVDGEEVVRYTNQKPKSGTWEIVRARRAVE